MTDKTKTKGELVVELRRRIAELEASEAERKRAEELLAGQREILEMVATGVYNTGDARRHHHNDRGAGTGDSVFDPAPR